MIAYLSYPAGQGDLFQPSLVAEGMRKRERLRSIFFASVPKPVSLVVRI
jgi:hypothetical protein